jgi:hypothetical protein
MEQIPARYLNAEIHAQKSRVARWDIFKYPNFGKIRRALKWKMLVHFMAIWNI